MATRDVELGVSDQSLQGNGYVYKEIRSVAINLRRAVCCVFYDET